MFDVKNSAPMRMIKKYNHLYPDAWDFIENIATNEEYKDMWPHEYVYAPIEAGLTLSLDRKKNQSELENVADGTFIACLAAWRRTKIIYDFDATLTEELYKQAKSNIELDTSMLTLPAYSIISDPTTGRNMMVFSCFLIMTEGTLSLDFWL